MAFSTFWQWSKTPASNTEINGKVLSNSATPTSLDDIAREMMGQIATGLRKGSDVASAGTVTLGDGTFFHITGNTGPITDIDFTDAADGRWAILEFDSTPTITHHATTLVLPGGADIVCAAGDRALIVQDSTDNVHVMFYQRAAEGPVRVAFAAYRSTNQTMTNGTPTKVQFDTEEFDVGGHYDNATNYRWTPPAGTYLIGGGVSSVIASDQNQTVLYLYKNGSAFKTLSVVYASGTTSDGMAGSALVSANGTDYFELFVTQTTGSDRAISGNQSLTYFWGHRV